MSRYLLFGSIAGLALAAGAPGGSPLLYGRIAFSAGPLEPGRSNVYVYDLRARKLTRVTLCRGIEFDPALSQDGKRVAWRSIRNGNEEVRVANVDGSAMRNLTRHPALDYALHGRPPAAGSRSRPLAVAPSRSRTLGDERRRRERACTHARVHRGVPRLVTGRETDRVRDQPARPSGRVRRRRRRRRRGERAPDHSDRRRGDGASWSPDGKWIALHVGSGGSHNLYLIHPDGSGRRRLTRGGGEMPSWSPDGRYIAYAAPAGLVVIRPDGTEVTRLSTGVSGGNFASWAR
jgi:hypothetical protein